MMTDKQKARFALEQWSAQLDKKDRTKERMIPILDQLANELFMYGIEFETANDIMKQGAKAVYPSPSTIQNSYAKSPMRKLQDIKEYTKSWHESIDRIATAAFYTYYTLEGADPTRVPTKKPPVKEVENTGMKTEDELNQEDFWKSVKSVSKDKPWLFDDEEKSND